MQTADRVLERKRGGKTWRRRKVKDWDDERKIQLK